MTDMAARVEQARQRWNAGQLGAVPPPG